MCNNWKDFENNNEPIDVRNRSISNGPKLNNLRSDHGIGILKLDGKEQTWVFGGFQKYEDPDETGPEPFFDSMKVYYPEKQMLMVADFTISQPRKLFSFIAPPKQKTLKSHNELFIVYLYFITMN